MEFMPYTPRTVAVFILNRIERHNAFAEPLLDAWLSRKIFTDIHDRRLLTQLVYGTLRMRNHIDWIICHIYRGNAATLDPGLKNILRVALFQIMFTDRIPPFAAVDEAVKAAKTTFPGREGLVNGILRNAIRRMKEIPLPDLTTAPSRHISVVHSHPEWMVTRWIQRLGVNETLSLCMRNNAIPPFTLRVNMLKTTRDDVLKNLDDSAITAWPTPYSPCGVTIENPVLPLKTLPLYTGGHIQVQDEASQLISFLAHPRPGEKILDLCAGVGIKTTHMAELMRNRGTVTALDIRDRKNIALRALVERLGATIITPRQGDAGEDLGAEFHGQFDRVVLDAPCSGLGTLRRHPEIKWRRVEKDIQNCAHIQKKILHTAASYTKIGGVLVYTTCSTEYEEDEAVVYEFLQHHHDYELVDPGPDISKDLIDRDGFFRTWPHHHNTDGFFGAILKRK